MKSFWQAYSSDISAPFHTNYRPEVFYETKIAYRSWGWLVWFSRVGCEHESNGRTDELGSFRSWNPVHSMWLRGR
ncbi:phospholipase A [Vibrio lentus]|nr:phospholipase A [Vibrio lentus]